MNHYKDPQLLAEKISNTRDTTRIEPEYLRTPSDLAHYLQNWHFSLAQEPSRQDLAEVLVLRGRLHEVFESADVHVAVRILNELLEGVHVRPHVEMVRDGGVELALDVEKDQPLARRLGVEAALGLIEELHQYGVERLHVCSATPCTEVFIDTSRNRTRRYCCEQCANRHNVAAHRQRQKRA